MDIQLTYKNNSNDSTPPSIVIFQKMDSTGHDEFDVAWIVIRGCGTGENHSFTYPMAMQVSCCDDYGNDTAILDATNGNVFSLRRGESGTEFSLTNIMGSPRLVAVQNDLDFGSISSATIYRDRRRLAMKHNILPREEAVFEFLPILYFGVASGVEEGMRIDPAVFSQVNTEISLLGVASADIVLTGGGDTHFRFELDNVQPA